MGCTWSKRRHEDKLLRILDGIVYSIASGQDELSFEIGLILSLKSIRDALIADCKPCNPMVLHQFNYAMTMLKQRKGGSFQRVRQDVFETLLLITARTPCPPNDLGMENAQYLNDRLSGKYAPCRERISLVSPTQPITENRFRGLVPDAGSTSQGVLYSPPKVTDFELIKEATKSTDSQSSRTSNGKFKSFYASRSNMSLETLSDFGFFEEETNTPPRICSTSRTIANRIINDMMCVDDLPV